MNNRLASWFNGLSPAFQHLISSIAIMVAGASIAAVAGVFGVAPPQVTIQPAQPLDPTPSNSAPPPPDLAYGWIPDQEEIAASKASVKTIFRNSPAGEADVLPADVYQWKWQEKVTGSRSPEKDQNPTGSCVGFGGTTAYERALVCSIAAGQPFEFTRFSEEAAYAMSRVNIGGGRLRGQDGSIGGWMARAQTDLGMVPAKKYGSLDLSKYDPSRCRQLGDRGLPQEILNEAGKYKAGSVANLRSWGDVKKALASGHGVFVCSMIGFAQQRDANGVCAPQGRWGHCMCLDGYHTEGTREYGHFDNSWDGVYHRGPVGWGSPTGTGFWADARVISQMLAEGDSWAVSAVKGFPKQDLNLDWFIAEPKKQTHPLAMLEREFHLAP